MSKLNDLPFETLWAKTEEETDPKEIKKLVSAWKKRAFDSRHDLYLTAREWRTLCSTKNEALVRTLAKETFSDEGQGPFYGRAKRFNKSFHEAKNKERFLENEGKQEIQVFVIPILETLPEPIIPIVYKLYELKLNILGEEVGSYEPVSPEDILPFYRELVAK